MNVNEIRVLQKIAKVHGQYYYTTYNLQVFDGDKWNDVPKVIEEEEPSESIMEKYRAGNLATVPVLTTSTED